MTGILVKREIEQAIANGQLLTQPGGAVLPADHQKARSCSYDMTVGTIFWEGRIVSGTDAIVTVPPGGVIALFTAEEISLPEDICATAFAINDMSSKGFLVVNPGHVDPGFKGALTVKALNVRKTPLAIQYGEPIFTVIFQRLNEATEPYPAIPERTVRERRFNATVVETAPKTFYEMMASDKDSPYPGREEVRRMIVKHWSTWGIVLVTASTLALAGVSAYFAAYPRSPPESPKAAASVTTEVGAGAQSAALPKGTSKEGAASLHGDKRSSVDKRE